MKNKIRILSTFMTLFCGLFITQAHAQVDSSDYADNGDPASYSSVVTPAVRTYTLSEVTLGSDATTYLSDKLSAYHVYAFDFADLYAYSQGEQYAVEFKLDYPGGATHQFTLQRNELRTPDFELEYYDGEGTVHNETRDPYGTPIVTTTYKGVVNQANDKFTRVSILNDNFWGYIHDATASQTLMFQSLRDFIELHGGTYTLSTDYLIVYDATAYTVTTGTSCGAAEGTALEKTTATYDACSPKVINIAIDVDKLYQTMNKGWNNAQNKILGIINQAEGAYASDFNVSFGIRYLHFLNDNPYTASKFYVDIISAVANRWTSNFSGVSRDMVFLFTGSDSYDESNSDVGGAAKPSSLTDPGRAYGFISASSGKQQNMVFAHELGHACGAGHDDQVYGITCTNTYHPIMCQYYNNATMFFSTPSKNAILDFLTNFTNQLQNFGYGTSVNEWPRTWNNNNHIGWLSSWHNDVTDSRIAGNFDGADDDEELFMLNGISGWNTIYNYKCDDYSGAGWQHLWGNSGSHTFGNWYMNHGDRYFAGDFNGDGKDEVLSISASNKWAMVQEYNPATWSWINKYTNSGSQWIGGWLVASTDKFIIGDFDGGGDDEILCISRWGWAQLQKYNSGGWFTTIWNNGGNGWIGGVYISTGGDRFLPGKYIGTSKDEVLCFTGTWTTVLRYDPSVSGSWSWIWSNNGAGSPPNIANMNILPLTSGQGLYSGNIDGDSRDEFMNINGTWAATADYHGSTFHQNWSNGGSTFLNDWDMNHNINNYLLVKATAYSPKQLMAWNFAYVPLSTIYLPVFTRMYRNDGFANFKPVPQNPDNGSNSQYAGNIFPNPASDHIIVKGYDKANYIITNILGQTVMSGDITAENQHIHISGLMNSIYFISLTNCNSPKQYKFVKQ